jgi:uncharacterized protein (DUF1697 family)
MARKRPTNRYVAFLRGINLGNRRVKMTDLKALFEQLAFANVATFIASGNVIFDTPAAAAAALEAKIEAHLQRELGYPVDTFLRTPAELAAISAFRPFAAADHDAPGHTIHVSLVREPISAADELKLAEFRTAMDDYCVRGREWFWLIRGHTIESLAGWQRLSKVLPVSSTSRNIKTIHNLAAKYPPA